MKKITSEFVRELKDNEVFVFGSNLAGHHDGGAALQAYLAFGAVYGQGVGFFGKSYAIPTMHGGIEDIKPYVDDFTKFAETHPEFEFLVTQIGCGIAGFTPNEIAPLFTEASRLENVSLPKSFWEVIESL